MAMPFVSMIRLTTGRIRHDKCPAMLWTPLEPAEAKLLSVPKLSRAGFG